MDEHAKEREQRETRKEEVMCTPGCHPCCRGGARTRDFLVMNQTICR